MKSPFRVSRCLTLVISMLLITGCISRASQPNISGTVVTPELTPIYGVKVTNHTETVVTDEEGTFNFEEERYYAFLLKEMFYMHPPPIFIDLIFEKAGYQTCHYESYNPYGGGVPKGTIWNLDNIILNPENVENSDGNSDGNEQGLIECSTS